MLSFIIKKLEVFELSSFANAQKITEIAFSQNIQCFCPLGNDWYTNQLEVTFTPSDIIPDYCDVDDFTRSLGGKALIIEDVVNAVYEYIVSNYNPVNLCVVSKVNDAKHMPVIVTKKM